MITQLSFAKCINDQKETVYGMEWVEDTQVYWTCVREDGYVYHYANDSFSSLPIAENKEEIAWELYEPYCSIPIPLGFICAECNMPSHQFEDYLCSGCREVERAT